MKIYDFFYKNVKKHPDKIAVIIKDKQYTYQEILDLIKNFPYNFKPSSHIGVLLENSIEFVVLLLLASKENFTLIPMPPNMPKNQLDNIFTKCDVEFLIEQCGVKQLSFKEKYLDESYIITTTSGSTSEPKPIVLTQNIKLKRIESAIKIYSLNNNDIVIVSTPMHHSLAQRGVLLPLVLGATVVIMDYFSPKKYLELIESYKATFSFAVSNQIESIANIYKNYDLSSLKKLVSTSYAIKPDTKKELSKDLNIYECYGTSEIGCVTNLSPKDLLKKINSVGKPLDYVDLKILHPDKNGIGEIAIKTPTSFKEYYKMQQETIKSFVGDYFKTGDLGYIKNNYLYYTGRKKEIIKTGGISVYPKDIEKVLLNVDGVKECAVIGIEDEYFGEAIVAVVVGNTKKSKLQKACMENLAPYQMPMHYDIVEELPKNYLGKLQKFKLKEKYKNLNIGKKLRGIL